MRDAYNVVDEHGTIRGVAMIDTKETSELRLVPNIVACLKRDGWRKW